MLPIPSVPLDRELIMEQDDTRQQKRKLFGVIVAFLAVCVIVTLIIININNVSPDDDTIETNSSSVEEYSASINDYVSTNHPISSLLPVIDDDSTYCISYDVSVLSDGSYAFNLTIDYKTEESKKAAEALLKSPEFTSYSPSQYKIVYTKID